MSSDPIAPPSVAQLDALDSDGWAVVLKATRLAIEAREVLEPELQAIREAPVSRLVAGPLRQSLRDELVTDPTLWDETQKRLPSSETWPETLAELVAEVSGASVEVADASLAALAGLGATAAEQDPLTAQRTRTGDGSRRELEPANPEPAPTDKPERERTRQKLRDVRKDRDQWRRRAEGAEARAQQLAQTLEQAQTRLQATEAEMVTLQRALDDAVAGQRSAVERERRRRDGEIERLEATIGQLKQQAEQRVAEERRRKEAEERKALRRRHDAQAGPPPTIGLVPGRPSQLPDNVVDGTTEAASLLLHRGRLVIVDGYNVTKQHRGHLDLEQQRSWLIQLLGMATASRRINPVVIFDGQQASGSRPNSGVREVQVRFTLEGITADDEVVLAVEGTDEPVVVVTDDRELVARVQASGADVISTRSFLGAAS